MPTSSTHRVLCRRVSLGIVMMSTAVVLSACGDSSPQDPNGKIDTAFIAKAESVCAAAQVKFNANGPFPYSNFNAFHPDPTLLPKAGAWLANDLPTHRALPGQITALGEPTTGANRWAHIRSIALKNEANAIAQTKDAQRSDVTGFVATAHEAQTLSSQLASALQPAGFSSTGACARVF